MRVFIDEAGDTGFKFELQSSRYFVVALAIFEDEGQEEKVSRRIDALRQELRTPNIEFHFVKNKKETRRLFLSAIKDMDFKAVVLIVDKSKLSQSEFKDRTAFYKAVCSTALEQAKPLLREANVLLDDSGGEKFKRELGSYLKKRLNSGGVKHLKNVGTETSSTTSQTSNLIQLADMICGAVYRSLQQEENAEEYREIIKHRLESVLLWPDGSTPAPREI